MRLKKAAAFLLAATVMTSGMMIPKVASAASNTKYESSVLFVPVNISDVNLNEIPTFSGVTDKTGAMDGEGEAVTTTVDSSEPFVFGGWYVMREDENLEGDRSSEYDTYVIYQDGMTVSKKDLVFAKWVPARVLSAKAQNVSGTSADMSGTTGTRMVTSVDCKDYQSVGYDIIVDGDLTVNVPIMRKAYSSLKCTVDNVIKTYTASELFGSASKYFVTFKLTGIPSTEFATKIFVKPYWVTAQGQKVYGLSRYAHVEDGIYKYVNVPVNLSVAQAQAVAAGVVTVNYDETKFEFLSEKMETGRVFEEMDANAVNGSVKIVGNVADIEKNATHTDLFVNLRFKYTGSENVAGSTWFDIGSVDFCDNQEITQDITIFDIPY